MEFRVETSETFEVGILIEIFKTLKDEISSFGGMIFKISNFKFL
jgi:hypothetical protein